MRTALFTFLALLTVVSSAGSFELGSSRGLGVGGNTFLGRPNPTDLLSIPAGGLAAGQWRIETGFTRIFDLKDLDQGFVAFAARFRSLSLAAGFSQLGHSSMYAERIAKAALMFQIDSLTLGMTGSYVNSSFGGLYPSLHASAIGLGMSWRSRRFLVALAGDNLNRPSLYSGAVPYQPLYSGQIELIGSERLSTLGRVLLQKMERPRFSLGQWIRLGQNGAVTWGLITAPLMFGGGIELKVASAELAYGASYHPVLGLSQTISVAVGSRSSKKAGGDHDFDR